VFNHSIDIICFAEKTAGNNNMSQCTFFIFEKKGPELINMMNTHDEL
jgi:hypothetical protein